MSLCHEPDWLMAVSQSHGKRSAAGRYHRPDVGRHQPPEQAVGEARACGRNSPRNRLFEKSAFKSTKPVRKRIVYNGAGGVYICVIGTLCEVPLWFLDFHLFENPKGAAKHKRDKPAEAPLWVQSDAHIYILTYVTPR